MKYLSLLCGLAVLTFTAPAQASERLNVGELHNFVANLNVAVNNSDLREGHHSLDRMIAASATFENNVNAYNNRYLVNNPYAYNHYGYRYPYAYNNYYAKTGFQALGKWDQISVLETKKRTIPGYKGTFELGALTIAPIGDTAVIDVDFKEHSLAYASTYAPYYYNHAALNGHSKCKMHVAKQNDTVYMTRMYCNTNTNLPL